MAPSVPNTERTPTRSASEGSFGTLAKNIRGWTTNLLATAIVLVGGLGLGWQVLAWWHEKPPAVAGSAELTSASLPLIGDSREFWTTHGPLKIERVSGGQEEAVAAMRTFCRGIDIARGDGTPTHSVGAPVPATLGGPSEQRFVTKLHNETPLEVAGDLALYQPRGQTMMVVAVSRSRQRIVGWSFGLELEKGLWSLYHFQPLPLVAGVTAPEPKAGNSP
jgi:hypothetical protein